MAVLTNKVYSPQNYIKKITGEHYIFNNDVNVYDEIQNLLEDNGFENVWNYPLTEIDHIIENDLDVVLVDISDKEMQEYRWFEVPKSYCKNFEDNKEELIFKVARELDLSFEEKEMLLHDINNLRGNEWLEDVLENCTKNTIINFILLVMSK
jgi:hypothetical protein